MNTPHPSCPPWATLSPIGIHITALRPFLQSTHIAPVSHHPQKRQWATQEGASQLSQMAPRTPAGAESTTLIIYNKSRDVDRVCLGCRRWYRVGESERGWDSFEDFLGRKVVGKGESGVGEERREEQEMSGICGGVCMDAMMEDSEEGERAAGREVRRVGGWVVRRTTVEQEAEGGVKVLWEEGDG